MGAVFLVFLTLETIVFLPALAFYFSSPSAEVFSDTTRCQNSTYQCSQSCRYVSPYTPNSGPFSCTCQTGYYLSPDGVSCLATGDHPKMLYAVGSRIKLLDTRGPNSPSKTVLSNVRNPVGLTYDLRTDRLVYSTIDTDSGAAGSSGVFWSKAGDAQEDAQTILDDEVTQPEGLAMDWLNQKLYVTDMAKKLILACALDGEACAAVLFAKGNVRAIAVHPAEGRMFWTDWGDASPGIECAGMDGSDRHWLISKDIIWPNGIAVDPTQNMVYWADSKTDRVERCDLQGNNREIIIHDTQHPFSIAVFENSIYWSDWFSRTIERADKSSGKNLRTLVSESGLPTGIFIHHDLAQPTGSAMNPCLSTTCDRNRMCLLAPEKRTTCIELIAEHKVYRTKTATTSTARPYWKATTRKTTQSTRMTPSATSSSHFCPNKLDFECMMGACIPESGVCNGEYDCTFGEDEYGCPEAVTKTNTPSTSTITATSTTTPTPTPTSTFRIRSTPSSCNPLVHFTCQSNGACISKRFECDGTEDCQFGEDEKDCVIKVEDPCKPSPCRYGHICNHAPLMDEGYRCICPPGLEEAPSGNCVVPDPCRGVACSADRRCVNAPHTVLKYECRCFPGTHEVDSTGKCIDIDECANATRLCSQGCENTFGAYQCTCKPGYHLASDVVSCIATGESPVLFYAAGSFLRSLLTHRDTVVTVRSHIRNPIGVAYHAGLDLVFWSEVDGATARVMSMPLHDQREAALTIVASPEVDMPEGLAMDWVNDLLYVTDKTRQRILACELDGERCTEVVRMEGSKIRALVLHPERRMMYWTDWSDDGAGIYCGSMDGDRPERLVGTGVAWPNGLALDYAEDLLYFADSKTDRIERVSLNGTDREIVLQDSMHPYSLAVFENQLYWTDWHMHSVETAIKTTGEGRRTLLQETGLPHALYLQHSLIQNKNLANPCATMECPYMCLLSAAAEDGAACAGPVEGSTYEAAHDARSRVETGDVWLIPFMFFLVIVMVAAVFLGWNYRHKLEEVREISLPLIRKDGKGKVLWRKRMESDSERKIIENQSHISESTKLGEGFDNPSYNLYHEQRKPELPADYHHSAATAGLERSPSVDSALGSVSSRGADSNSSSPFNLRRSATDVRV